MLNNLFVFEKKDLYSRCMLLDSRCISSPPLTRRHAVFPLKHPREIRRIPKPHLVAHFRHRLSALAQQLPGPLQPRPQDVLRGRQARQLLQAAVHLGAAEVDGAAEVVEAEVGIAEALLDEPADGLEEGTVVVVHWW